MYYSIGEVSHITGIAVSTLRYYDREGMFPDIKRSNGGIRIFSQKEIETLRIIDCLKTTGMSIKEIKEFLGWLKYANCVVTNSFHGTAFSVIFNRPFYNIRLRKHSGAWFLPPRKTL